MDFSVLNDVVLIGGDSFIQAVVESCFPDLDGFLGATCNKVIPVSTEFGVIRVALEGVFEFTHF